MVTARALGRRKRLLGETALVRRTAEEAAETREAILRAARKLFSDKGFADTSLVEVATRAGLTRGALYHHFTDKRELFAEVFGEVERELDAAAKAAAAGAAGRPRQAFLAGCAAYLDFARRPDFHRIVLTDGPAVLGATGWRKADAALGLPTIEAAVKALIAVGAIAPRPAKPLAVLLFGALNESGFALARSEPGLDADSLLGALGALLDGLAP